MSLLRCSERFEADTPGSVEAQRAPTGDAGLQFALNVWLCPEAWKVYDSEHVRLRVWSALDTIRRDPTRNAMTVIRGSEPGRKKN